MTKEIDLTKGLKALVDDEDFERLSVYKWYAHSGYAYRRVTTAPKKNKLIGMHRVIINANEGEYIDHIDGDKLNNQKNNLRLCSYAQNNYNQNLPKRNITGFKGITQHPDTKRWRATIMHNYKIKHLGYFKEKLDAVKAYDKAALELFGDFAKTNKMLGLY
jgi:hypothetical protein